MLHDYILPVLNCLHIFVQPCMMNDILVLMTCFINKSLVNFEIPNQFLLGVGYGLRLKW